MKKIVLMLVAALVCTGAVAKDKKTNKKKQAQPVEVVDTISIDQFSALMGCVNTQGLQQYLLQQKGIDAAYMKDFLEGFGVGEMTESDKKQKARIAGMEIRQQVVAQMLPSINRQIDDTQDRINTELFLKGFMAGVEGKDVDGISMDSANVLVQKNMQYYHQVQMERKYGQNRQEGVDFLAKNAKRGEVKTTPSGLQYEILVKGDGPVAQATDRVKVHYRGTLIDGTEFDSSYKRGEPATFGVGQVIKGWTEALTMMPTGSKWMLYIPQELAYGDRESGKIKPFSALIFEVELLEVVK